MRVALCLAVGFFVVVYGMTEAHGTGQRSATVRVPAAVESSPSPDAKPARVPDAKTAPKPRPPVATKPAPKPTTTTPRPPQPAPGAARVTVAPVDASKQNVLVQYQRIGHGLHELQTLRGYPATFELWPRFRAIRLDSALATPAARLATLAELDDIGYLIERARGIDVSSDCLTNPLVRRATRSAANTSAASTPPAELDPFVCEISQSR